ncbi:hypothetical protein EFA46_012435 (plasmid) [Halarchaeum sp. CBA1220]|uniref:hypothetical protein n=1 Tax=Halarchaeum sp. CBA1220 TaxID=1853682 RepID=UPI000F3A9D0A|nr:hypothetical protein [Halarchaeum sp. CBA1220]QLC35058.1 hypothetical protein EFA46_012435 [Halarchaeum sp. CBA1220]
MENVQLTAISPKSWQLLRVAADYTQRAVEREVDGLVQAHISMLEGGNRSLSEPRRRLLFDLYTAELTHTQVRAIVENF